MKKRMLLPLAAVVILLGLLFLFPPRRPLPEKYYGGSHFGIERYFSATDKDGDGVDDQSDLYNAAVAYLQTAPKYKSKYYEGGYPNDEYGVCTDVVAIGLYHAGYDLQKLVDADIAAAPDAYPAVDKADPNIDFRRVRNLSVYFSRHAITLTTDLAAIDAWQPGDVVVFEKHIGIVSEKRDADGVPYLWHHANPRQTHYEEPLAGYHLPIIGHYRIS